MSKEFRFVEEKIYALYEVIRRQEYPKRRNAITRKSDMLKVNLEEDHE